MNESHFSFFLWLLFLPELKRIEKYTGKDLSSQYQVHKLLEGEFNYTTAELDMIIMLGRVFQM